MLPVTLGPAIPDPLNVAILVVPSVAFVKTESVLFDVVSAVGTKDTSIVHVPASAREAPVQVSEVFVKGAATVALVMVKLAVPPVLVSVNVLELVLPIVTFP